MTQRVLRVAGASTVATSARVKMALPVIPSLGSAFVRMDGMAPIVEKVSVKDSWSVYPSVCLSLCPSDFLFVQLAVRELVCLSIYLFVPLSVHLTSCLSSRL